MSGTVLERSLRMVAMRLQKLRMLRSQSMCWVMLLLPSIIACLWLPASTGIFRTEFVVVLGATLLGILLSRATVRQPSDLETARLIERQHPELNDAVLTAVRVNESFEQRSSVMAEMVIRHADRLARQADWTRVVPSRQMMAWSLVSFLSFICMVSGVFAASRWGRHNGPVASAAALGALSAEEEQKVLLAGLTIEPGDVEIESGSALTVVARFADGVPLRAALEFTSIDGEVRTMAMSETVDAGVFAARMEEVVGDGTYVVRFDPVAKQAGASDEVLSATSAEFRVSTFVRPQLEQADALITPPPYTGREPQLIEDTLRVVAVEGSTVQIQLHLNKPVAIAELRSKDGAATLLTASAADPQLFETVMVAIESQSWSIYLEDLDGRTAAEEELFSIRVTHNDRPNIKVTFPGRDTDVSPLQEFLVEAQAVDDFGLADFGVEYSIVGQEQKSVSLASQQKTDSRISEGRQTDQTAVLEPVDVTAAAGVSGPKSVNMAHTIELETLGAEPDNLVTYYFYADDVAGDGAIRRTFSDIMFADVRRFEEIFREGQQQSQQQQQQQQQQQVQQSPVDGVLKLQKEIISATWNLLRRESDVRRAGTWTKDVDVIAQSQAAAVEQLEQAMEQAGDDPKVAALAEEVRKHMQDAQQVLEEIRDEKEGAKISSAMLPEQSAYQTLLKMRAAEIEVRQQQQQQGGGGGGGGQQSRQQQLQQLELDNDRNRYESERQAQQQQEQSSQQREQLQILNRLKELARRQQMLNERMKQLESELRAATTEKERDEIERELKRLRDEQREMLRDVDEVRERMDQAADRTQQPQDAQVREQVEQARDNVQRASEAMEQGKLSEAIAEGTRAEREFEQARDEMRDQTSSQFTDAMRDLREQARELSEKQEELGQQLAGQSGDSTEIQQGERRQRPSLRTDRNREQLEQQVRQQRDRLSQIVEESKQVIEQAEQTEPLLSTRLYDTLRDMREMKPEEALEAAEFLTGRGMWQQSQQAEQIARQGIDQLRKGIENAADAVLGSEAEAMRRAREELQDLSSQLAEEVQTAKGEAGEPQSANASQQDPSGGYAPAGESQEGDQQRREQQDGQAGQSANAEGRQPSERRSGQAGSQTQQQRQQNNGQNSEQGKERGAGRSDEQQSPGESTDQLPSDQQQQERRPGQGRGQKEQEPQEGDMPPSDQSSDQPGSQPGQGERQGVSPPGESQPGGPGGQQPGGQQPGGQQPGGQQRGGQQQGGQQQGGQQQGGQQQRSSLLDGGRQEGLGGGGNNRVAQPLTGQEFTEWSDRLREVEEMLDDPDLRNRVAQVRDRARAIRAEFKRHGTEPQWDLVKSQLLGEMQALQKRIAEELARIESSKSMVPIDREPVPEEFDSLVQRYYELLGQQRRRGNQE